MTDSWDIVGWYMNYGFYIILVAGMYFYYRRQQRKGVHSKLITEKIQFLAILMVIFVGIHLIIREKHTTNIEKQHIENYIQTEIYPDHDVQIQQSNNISDYQSDYYYYRIISPDKKAYDIQIEKKATFDLYDYTITEIPHN